MEGIKKVILIIADISGYTDFMVTNVQALEHSQEVISELIKVIIQQVELPLDVAKLEGDAAFLYATSEDPENWNEIRSTIGEKLIGFFSAFQKRIQQLTDTTCTCGACVNINKLRLKLIVHSGEAFFYRIGKFLELAGVDVIIVHRLLKNSVAAKEYILLTDAARNELILPGKIQLQQGKEKYPALGEIGTWLYCKETTNVTTTA